MLRLVEMDGNDSGTTHFAANELAVRAALAAVRRFAEAKSLGADDTARLAIVVEELVANLVEHGGTAGTEIGLRLIFRPDAIGLTLTDRGTYFDLRAAEPAVSVPDRGGGAGIALVLAWARIEQYVRSGGLNRLDLVVPLTQR